MECNGAFGVSLSLHTYLSAANIAEHLFISDTDSLKYVHNAPFGHCKCKFIGVVEISGIVNREVVDGERST